MQRQTPRDPLSELCAAARADRAPELDRARLEARLVTQFEAARARGELAPQARAEAVRRLSPWLAVAALLVLGIGLAREWTSLTPESASRDVAAGVAPRTIDGDALALESSVAAGPEHALRVEHERRAVWELAAGSGAHLIDAGSGVLCVELERGALSATVTPSRAESFMVRARGTEVAVHGTRFRVELDGERVLVSVSEGEVEVRPAPLSQRAGALERTSRVRLTAGMHGAFVAGVPEAKAAASTSTAPAPKTRAAEPLAAAPAVAEPAPAPRAAPAAPWPVRKATPAVPAARPASGKESGAPRPRAAAPEAPVAATPAADSSAVPAAVTDPAIARVTEHIQSCFRRHTSGRGPVSIEAATQVSLEVQSNGLILGVSLDPPLAPQVEACVAEELASLNLGSSESGFRVRREIRLSP